MWDQRPNLSYCPSSGTLSWVWGDPGKSRNSKAWEDALGWSSAPAMTSAMAITIFNVLWRALVNSRLKGSSNLNHLKIPIWNEWKLWYSRWKMLYLGVPKAVQRCSQGPGLEEESGTFMVCVPPGKKRSCWRWRYPWMNAEEIQMAKCVRIAQAYLHFCLNYQKPLLR